MPVPPAETNLTNSVLVPSLQAAISGGFVGLTVGGIAWALHGETPAAVGLASGSLTACVAWFTYRADWQKRLESVLGIQQPTAPAAEFAQTVRVEVISEQGHHGDYLDLPGGRERLSTLAQGLTNGKPFTTRQWTGGRGIYTPSEFEELRGELLARGLARWRNQHDNRGGIELTAKGRATFRGLALVDQTPPPQPGLTLEKL